MFGEKTFRAILVVSLMMHAFDMKYLLVNVEENRIELKGNQSTSISNSGVIKSRTIGKLGPYSKTVRFNDRFRDSCVNKKLVKKGSFTMKKTNYGRKNIEWRFQAILKKGSCCKDDEVLSTLDGNIGGVCNSMETHPGSYKCGLATALMEFCFTDLDIGTYNPADSTFKIMMQESIFIKAKYYRDLALSNCDHMVYLKCSPTGTLPKKHAACSGYLTAALNTGHTMMFTYDKGPEKWDVPKITTAKIMLKQNSDTFIEDYGEIWLFCKCKSDRITQCENMI